MKNKKHTRTIALLLLIILLVTFCPITSLAEGGGTLETVYWDITAGNDNNAGDSSNPVKTFAKARELLAANGTIYLVNGGTLGAEEETWSLPSADYGSAKVVVISNGFGAPIDIPVNKTLLLENLVIEGAESSSFTKNIFNINKGYCTLTLGEGVVIQNISSTKSLVYAMVQTTNPMVILDGAEIKSVSLMQLI